MGKVVSSNAVYECLINPKTLFAFFTADGACVWKFKRLSTTTPRSFSPFTYKVVCSNLSQYAYFDNFSTLNGNCQIRDHRTRLSISSCNEDASSFVIMGLIVVHHLQIAYMNS